MSSSSSETSIHKLVIVTTPVNSPINPSPDSGRYEIKIYYIIIYLNK